MLALRAKVLLCVYDRLHATCSLAMASATVAGFAAAGPGRTAVATCRDRASGTYSSSMSSKIGCSFADDEDS